jgi:CRISPR/Cas system CSM-associated protein Csm5 (group 7 of RAMP superfamily)
VQPAVSKQVQKIKGRVRGLKSDHKHRIDATKIPRESLSDQDDRLVPRVTGLVVREANWLVKLANRVVARAEYKPEEKEKQALADAEIFFAELSETHEAEIKKNLFIDRMDAEFITYMEKLVLLIEKVDAINKAKIAAVATLDDEAGDDDEIAAEIAAEMTA